MSESHVPKIDEVDHLLRNAQLRDELEPFFDESIARLNVGGLSTPAENEYLASMLAWERAPVLPISQWYTPELMLPRPETLGELELHQLLWDTIYKLFSQRIVLDFTDHLSDQQLYCLIYRDILPAPEKRVSGSLSYLHWDCADVGGDPDIWLRYYANETDRDLWQEHNDDHPLPATEPVPFPRKLPRAPL